MRRLLTALFIVVGAAIMITSYFFFAAPWGFPPNSVEHSNPIVPFAPGLFIIGFLVLFLSAVVYEILPERSEG